MNHLQLIGEFVLGTVAYQYDATYTGVDSGTPWRESEKGETDTYTYATAVVGAGWRF